MAFVHVTVTPDEGVIMLFRLVWLEGNAHSGTGNVASGAATNAESSSFRSDTLAVDLFFMG